MAECDRQSDAADQAADPVKRSFLTKAKDFDDVSRGKPIPHTLKGEALVQARLTPETWRLATLWGKRKPKFPNRLRWKNQSALDYAWRCWDWERPEASATSKALQCNNIAYPLGQGLWEGAPLAICWRCAGRLGIFGGCFTGDLHNNDPKQMFRSSMSLTQVLDTPAGEMPPIVAYRLNGEAIPLKRTAGRCE